MKRTDIEEIIADIIAREAVTSDDKALFEQWLDSSDENRAYFARLKAMQMPDNPEERPELHFSDVEEAIIASKRRRRLRYYAAAAVVVLLMVSPIYLILRNAGDGANQEIIADNFTKPILTLSNGEKVILGENESIIDGTLRIKAGENSLVYDTATDSEQLYYNTLTIPRGGEYTLRFADGSLIHLNSATELRYPVSFAGETREVYLSGEAYFEIESDAKKPFIVHAGGIDVKVTGTSFNVNAYPDRQIVTATLEEGAVQLLDGTHTFDMTPGMHACYDKATAKTEIKKVNTTYYTSWKDGYICFDDMRMEDILDILSLWYDLDVIYLDQEAKDISFGGRCTRYEQVAYLLGKFGETGEIDFIINGRNISVRSKR